GSHMVQAFPFCRSWIVLISLRMGTGLDGIFSVLEAPDGALGDSGLARQKSSGKLLACARISSRYRGSTTLAYSRKVSWVGSRTSASAIMDRSGPPSA